MIYIGFEPSKLSGNDTANSPGDGGWVGVFELVKGKQLLVMPSNTFTGNVSTGNRQDVADYVTY